MLIDLHTHTTKHSGCSRVEPEKLIEAAIDAGLDGIALTEHDIMWNADDLSKLQIKYSKIKIFNSIEVTVQEKEHILVYGVLNSNAFYKLMPIKELEKVVKAENGMMVVAHPFRYKEKTTEEIFNCDVEGVEVASINFLAYMKSGVDYIKSRKSMIEVSGSDAHDPDTVGMFATNFSRNIINESDLVKAIRAKEFTLFKNIEKIKRANNKIDQQVTQAKGLIEQGLSDAEIKQSAGYAYSFLYAVRNGKDVSYLI